MSLTDSNTKKNYSNKTEQLLIKYEHSVHDNIKQEEE